MVATRSGKEYNMDVSKKEKEEEEWNPKVGDRVKKIGGEQYNGYEGTIVEITEGGKLKVEIDGLSCEKEVLKKQSISNFIGNSFNIGDIVIEKKSKREGKILNVEIDKIKVELLPLENESEILRANPKNLYEPISLEMENPVVQKTIVTETVEKIVPNPQEKEVVVKRTVIEETITTVEEKKAVKTDTKNQNSQVQEVEKKEEGSIVPAIVCFIAIIAYLYMKKLFS
jgi:hypothetical protein